MKLILLMLISVSCFAQSRTTYTYEANDSIEFVSVITLDKQKLPSLELKLNEPREYHFLKGQNVFPVVVTAPPDPTKAYYIVYTLREEGVIIDDPDPDPVTQTIDSESLIYAGWFRHGSTSDPSWYGGTISYSSTGEAMYTFTGTGVEIHGETGPSHGTGTISVGTQSKTVSWRSDTRKLPAKVGEFTGLPQGQHTIVIKPVSGTVLIDFLVIHK